MPKRKRKTSTSPKDLTVFSRNSYIGRIKGVIPAFLPGRCNELTISERKKIELVHRTISQLLTAMEKL